jgi:hypothetical protein
MVGRAKWGIENMNVLNRRLERACGVGSAAIGMLLVTATASFAGVPAVPAPVIGLAGPYGILAAGVAYAGFLVYRKLKNRG